MRHSLLRALITVATFVVVWLVVTPARAGAPVCDPRGAITFAPPPQIQDEERSIDVVNDCGEDSPLDVSNVVPGRGCSCLDWSSSQEPASMTLARVPAFGATGRLDAPAAATAHPPRGIATGVERPPRS